MTEPLCRHGHPAWGCPDLRVEWDPLTVPEEPEPPPMRRDATLVLLAFLGMAVIAVIAWSLR